MKKILLAILIILPVTSFAIWFNPFSWNDEPQAPTLGATVFRSSQVGSNPVVDYYLKTDGTNSTWAAVVGGGGGGAGTFSTSTVNGVLTQYPYTTLETSLDGSATSTSDFWFSPFTSRSFLKYASSTGLTATNLYATNFTLGTLSGLLKGTSGVIGAATAGVDYENPLTFSYPLQRTTNTISLALSTTTSNTWAGVQTFTNAPIMSSLTGVLKGNGSSALTVAANGTDYTLISATTCGGTDKVSAISASGAVTCTADSGGSGGSAYEIATSSDIAISGLSYFTKTAGMTTLGSVATGTISSSGGITTTAGRSAVGGALSIACDVASGSIPGCLSAANWTTFNDKQAALVSGSNIKTINGSSVLGSGDLVVTASAGLGTTTPWTIGQLAMVSSNTAVTSVATSSLTINAPLTSAGTAGFAVGGSGWTLDIDDIKAADLDLTDITLNDFTNDAGFLTSMAFSYPFPSAATSTRLTFSGGLDFTYSSSTAYSSFITASTTNLLMNGQSFNSLLGAGLQNTAGALTLNATGDWTGTIDGNNFAGGAIGAGDMLYGASAGSITELTLGASSTILTTNGTIPIWQDMVAYIRGLFTGGRSITTTAGTIDVDAELYTFTKSIVVSASTEITATTTVAQMMFPSAVTITRVACSTDVGTAVIQGDERAAATPNTAGTDVMTGTLTCDSNEESTTSFANAGIAANVPLNFDIDSVATAPRRLRINISYTIDD